MIVPFMLSIRDDDSLFDLLNGSHDAEELAAGVMLRINDIDRRRDAELDLSWLQKQGF
jgi:hypothetical protein